MVEIHDTGIRLTPRLDRVIAKAFLPGTSGFSDRAERIEGIAHRVMKLDSDAVEAALELLHQRFKGRHRNLEEIWIHNMETAAVSVPSLLEVQDPKLRLLLGASFTQEYAIEGAALTNPSMVPTDQPGEFILSLRAIGEGHISAVEFRTGRVGPTGEVVIDPPGRYARLGNRRETIHSRDWFKATLDELMALDEAARLVIEGLPERFGTADLASVITKVADRDRIHRHQAEQTFHLLHWLATSNYQLVFNSEDLSERVLYPAGPADSQGMEDARFVRFTAASGEVTYYATYTAYDGFRILPQLITTPDLNHFHISTLHGACAQNKGMALFPRPIDGRFVALSRHDQTNLHLLWSDDVRQWNNAEYLIGPGGMWEMIQIGNCGSPLETDQGWLVLTHGVGPMRTYSLGAILLDRDQPENVIGRLPDPLLQPDWAARDGYVPNVVYSCGGMINGGTLVLPYGISDRDVGVALVDVGELLDAMV